VIADCGGQRLQGTREVGEFLLAREGLPDPAADLTRAVDVPLVARHEERGEERKALDVVPVRVRDQQVPADPAARDEMLAELMCPAAAIENDQRVVGTTDLDAGGVASVANGGRPGLGKGAARAPEANPHVALRPAA